MRFKFKALFIITPLVLFLDQLTKWLVIRHIPFGGSIPVIPGYFDLVFYKNTGAAFGMLSSFGEGGKQYFFYIVAAVAVVVLSTFYSKIKDEARMLPTAIALVFAGIAGNIIDRIRFGAVTDFLSFHIKDAVLSLDLWGWRMHLPLDWPAFNVADAAITVAMCMLLITAFRAEKEAK